ncbi:hypothetical protein BAC1_00416 [uncultured bacterium]|nr:hypothetical protein BAC1_00416 [uncultured bacterium]
MKRFLACLFFASAVAFAVSPVIAATGIEVTIEEEVETIDEEASLPDGEAAVIGKIENEFDVDGSLISGLRAQKLGYGEITLALSLAERLPGGINDENIEKILSMRQGETVEGWGNIARELGLKLNPSADRLERVSDETAVEKAKMEAVRPEKAARVEKAGKPERVEKAEKIERVEKVERLERPERPERGPKK